MGGKDARKPTARGEKTARARAHTADGHTATNSMPKRNGSIL